MKIIKKLENELDKNIPDIKDNIKGNVSLFDKKSVKRKFVPALTISICSVALIAVAIILPFLLIDNNCNYLLTIYVNPVIRLTYDDDNKVISQQGLNQDGVIFLYKENYLGLDVETATQQIVTKLMDKGLIKNKINIDIKNDSGKQSLEKEEYFIKYIKSLVSNEINISTITEDDLELLEDFYEDNIDANYDDKIRNKILDLAHDKVNDIVNLQSKIVKYTNFNEDLDETIIPDFEYKKDLEKFTNDYNFKIKFDINTITYSDLLEFYEDLSDNLIEINECLDEISQSTNEKDREDLIDDMFDLYEDLLFEVD